MNPTSFSMDSDTAAADSEPQATSQRLELIARYEIHCPPRQVEQFAREIAFEQTVEVPESLVTSEQILEQVVGRVAAFEPHPEQRERFLVDVGYPVGVTGYQLPQLLNLIYGNISMKPSIRLLDLDLPGQFLARFRGPNFGVAGLRQLLGVYGRPLVATALKPAGSSAAELASLAYEFCLGGGDIVKDDHNLHDATFDEFRDRVARCQDAAQRANQRTGRQSLYFPNIMAPVDQLEGHVQYVASLGVRGILISPFLVGLDMVRYLAEKYQLLMMAHPTVSGAFFHDPTHGIAPGLLLGKLFRLIGADISIFPNSGGRFSFTPGDCARIGRQLQSPLGDLLPAWPAPAGGMRFDSIPRMSDQFGRDAVFLIGGALLLHSESLEASTREFLRLIGEHFQEEATVPKTEPISACELPEGAATVTREISRLQHLPFQDFHWTGRRATLYKGAATELPFSGVARHELIGRYGEQTAFDLRYFEIEPGGYSSLEKHVHTHTVIGVRGRGTLVCGDESCTLEPFDVAYVPPLAVHQLRNPTAEPFGFFCIVDHDRDRPRSP